MGYKFVESDTGCEDCFFVDKPMKWCRSFDCQSDTRADGKGGYFIEIEEAE